MAASTSVAKVSVNAIVTMNSGMRMEASIVGPPMRNTEAGWCSVLHHSTENLMIGKSIAPTSVRMAAARAARDGSSTIDKRDHAG